MAQKTVFDLEVRAELVARIRSLDPQAAPRWGRLSCGRMVAHATDVLRMALGDIAIAPRSGPLRLALIRYLIIHRLPFPKGAPTAPELVARSGEDIRVETESFLTQLARFADPQVPLAREHPAFGPMTRADWGVLMYRHTSHHLAQFGA